MNKALMLQCDASMTSLPDILGLVSLGRQYCTIEVHAKQGGILGELAVKAGMLLSAKGPTTTGHSAFAALLHDSHPSRYEVYRVIEPPQPFPSPLGTLEQLLLEAAVSHDEAQRTAPSTASAVPDAAPARELEAPAAPANRETTVRQSARESWWSMFLARFTARWRGR